MTPAEHPDARLRQTLQQALDETGRTPQARAHSQALQERVLVQWQQRQGPIGLGAAATLGGNVKGLHSHWRKGLAMFSVVALVSVLAWCQREDPKVEELMQPDVLSQITMDAL